MNLKKVAQAYQLSGKFCFMMEKFEKDKIMYGQLKENSDYFKFENLTGYMMKNHKLEMIIGSFGHLIRHPKTMINSQKYYNEGFGKPCEMGK